jgi:hypothetical protein
LGAPDLDDKEAEDVAIVVLNNMKTMVGMAKKDVPTTPGALDQLRLMNRLYLAAVLRPARLTTPIADKLKGRARAARNS